LHAEVVTKVKIWVVGPDGEGAPSAKSTGTEEKAGRKPSKADKKK